MAEEQQQATDMKHFLIEKNFAQAVFDYILGFPCRDVISFVNAMQTLPSLGQDENARLVMNENLKTALIQYLSQQSYNDVKNFINGLEAMQEFTPAPQQVPEPPVITEVDEQAAESFSTDTSNAESD